ncbi:unnamed protein product [Camellia sinensis]
MVQVCGLAGGDCVRVRVPVHVASLTELEQEASPSSVACASHRHAPSEGEQGGDRELVASLPWEVGPLGLEPSAHEGVASCNHQVREM